MKIFVAGTRGIPDIPGGVEKHCQELYPRIVAQGHDVILCTRSPYVKRKRNKFKGVQLEHVFAPRIKSLEAVYHTFASLVTAWRYRPDIIHIHAIGPSLLIPVARLMGFKVVMTHHGPEYDRQKWGRFAKLVLKVGEYLGGRFANEVIVISRVINAIISNRCGRQSNLIYNGVPIPEKSTTTEHLDRYGIAPGKYILTVARFVPEKGLHDLIDAFRQTGGNVKLVIAGDADHETRYSKKLRAMAAEDDRIILTGYISGEPLKQVFTYAGLFVLPSYHEGLPIALLEAMSYGIPVLVSDIPANKEVGLSPYRYFHCGNVADLKEKILMVAKSDFSQKEKEQIRNQIVTQYNWNEIAQNTISVYEKVMFKSIDSQ